MDLVPVQCHGPMATARHESTADRVTVGRCCIETDRQGLMVRTSPHERACEVAILCDLAWDYRRALKWIKAEAVRANRKQTLRCAAAGWVRRHDGTSPATEQAIPGQDFARLKSVRDVLATTRNEGAEKQRAQDA